MLPLHMFVERLTSLQVREDSAAVSLSLWRLRKGGIEALMSRDRLRSFWTQTFYIVGFSGGLLYLTKLKSCAKLSVSWI